MPVIPKPVLSRNLDLLRAYAVICVYVSHLLGTLGLAKVGSLGRFGVVLFFIHTSLVLMQSMDRLETAAATQWRMVLAFWVRRLFRIYPLAILVIVAVVMLHVPVDPNLAYRRFGLSSVLVNLALVQNFTTVPDVLGPLWSLPLEIDMYLVLPFAFLWLRSRQRGYAVLLWAFCLPLAWLLPRLNWRLQVASFAPCFVAGAVAYALLKQRPAAAWRLPAWVWPMAILATTLAFGCTDDITIYQKLPRAWGLALLLGILCAYVQEPKRMPLSAAVHWIAEHSYGIYLSHIVLFWLLLRHLGGVPMAVRELLLGVCSLAVPALLYSYVERPMMLTGAHLSRRVLKESRTR